MISARSYRCQLLCRRLKRTILPPYTNVAFIFSPLMNQCLVICISCFFCLDKLLHFLVGHPRFCNNHTIENLQKLKYRIFKRPLYATLASAIFRMPWHFLFHGGRPIDKRPVTVQNLPELVTTTGRWIYHAAFPAASNFNISVGTPCSTFAAWHRVLAV